MAELPLLVAAPRRAPPRAPNRSGLPGLFSSAEELIATVGLKPGNVDSARHVEALKNFPGLRIDSPQIALVVFPSGVPQLSSDPGHTGDEAIRLDGAKNRACVTAVVKATEVMIQKD